MPEIKDFTKKRTPIQFKVDDDIFDAAPVIAADTMITFAESMSTADPTKMAPKEIIGLLRNIIEIVLLPASLVRFNERMKDTANPIDMEQLDEIVTWLFEEYGMRPTVEPSSSSAGGSAPVPGITSTAMQPDVVSISAASPSTAS